MSLYHVAIGFEGQQVPVATIQNAFATYGWARYAPNCWIVSTGDSAKVICEKVRALCNKNDSIFVVEINQDNDYGYLQNEIWDWLKARKSEHKGR